MSPDGLTKDEFLAHIGYVREDISQVHRRLDELNGRTRTAEVKIGEAAQRLVALETKPPTQPDQGKAGAVGALGGGVIVAAAEIIRAWWK